MIYSFLKNLNESISYLGKIFSQLEKDCKNSNYISLQELNTDNYQEALNHLKIAMELLNQQKVVSKQYEMDENEKEEQEGNKMSRRIDSKIVETKIVQRIKKVE